MKWLYQLDKASTWLQPRTEEKIDLLIDASRNVPLNQLHHIAGFMAHRCDQLAAAAARACASRVERMDALELIDTSQSFRRVSSPYYEQKNVYWTSIQPRDLPRIAALSGMNRGFALLTFHRDGHIRERALKLLGTANCEWAASFHLLRTFDWVPEVAAAADGLLSKAMRRLSLREKLFLKSMIGLLRNRFYYRLRHVACDVEEQLTQIAPGRELDDALADYSDDVRRKAYKLAWEMHPERRLQLATAGIIDRVNEIGSFIAARTSDLQSDDRVAVLQMLIDKCASVVFLNGLRECYDWNPDIWRRLVEPLLYDYRLNVTTHIAYGIRRGGEQDQIDKYREIVHTAEPGRLIGSINAIGQLGTAEDVQPLVNLLDSESQAVRAAACRALGAISIETLVSQGVKLLADPNRLPPREYVRALARQPYSERLKVLRELVKKVIAIPEPDRPARGLLALISGVSAPERQLMSLAMLSVDINSSTRNKYLRMLERSCGDSNVFSYPTGYVSDLHAHLQRADSVLSSSLASALHAEIERAKSLNA